jgi:hypothetical protein
VKGLKVRAPLTALLVDRARACTPNAAVSGAVWVHAGLVPGNEVWLDRSALGAYRVWLHRRYEWQDGVTAGQMATALLCEVQPEREPPLVAIMAEAILHASQLAKARGDDCPFCQLLPCSSTCIVVRVRREMARVDS